MAKMGGGGGRTHTTCTRQPEGAEDYDQLLKELTATFRNEDKTGKPNNKQLAEMANKHWGKRLHQEKFQSVGKIRPPGKLS